jgi:hypothetical protein
VAGRVSGRAPIRERHGSPNEIEKERAIICQQAEIFDSPPLLKQKDRFWIKLRPETGLLAAGERWLVCFSCVFL